jgi:hypothetical protein
MESQIILTPAERMYANHLKNVSNYQKKNVEKVRQKNRAYNEKIKMEFPDKYFDLLQKKRDYYYNVRKPKMQKKNMEEEPIELPKECMCCSHLEEHLEITE